MWESLVRALAGNGNAVNQGAVGLPTASGDITGMNAYTNQLGGNAMSSLSGLSPQAGTSLLTGANLSSLLSGIGTIGNLWGANRALGLAQDQFKFAKQTTNTNLNNQIKSYNTALEDRARSRGAAEGQSADTTQAYIDKNRMTR